MYGVVEDEDRAAIVDCIERGVKEVVGTLIVEFGSFGKAPLVEQVSLEEGRALSESGNLKVQVKRADAAAERSVSLCPYFIQLREQKRFLRQFLRHFL